MTHRYFYRFIILLTIITCATLTLVQAQCDVEAEEVITVVDETCSGIGSNEVCYGSFDVNIIAQEAAPNFTFESPGDTASLGYVRSLVLSALDPASDTWGIAQMRLPRLNKYWYARCYLTALWGCVD